MTDKATKEFFTKCSEDKDLMKRFMDNPADALASEGLKLEDLPEKVASKIAGGGTSTDVSSGASAAAGACG